MTVPWSKIIIMIFDVVVYLCIMSFLSTAGVYPNPGAPEFRPHMEPTSPQPVTNFPAPPMVRQPPVMVTGPYTLPGQSLPLPPWTSNVSISLFIVHTQTSVHTVTS